MLFHGSPVELNIGDTLRPGKEIGKNSNGACSEYVYASADFGFSMSDAQDWVSGDSLRTTQEFALWDAAMWGCSGCENDDSPAWVYVVDGEIVGMDEHMDAGPAAVKMNSATIVEKFKVERNGFRVDTNALRRSLKDFKEIRESEKRSFVH